MQPNTPNCMDNDLQLTAYMLNIKNKQ